MLIILDRDGVINFDSIAHIKSPQEWRPIPGSLNAIADLNRAGFQVVIASNQSGLARGFFDAAMLATIHQKMHAELAKVGGHIDAIFYCPHGPDDGCDCRKPRPGLLKQIAKRYPDDFDSALMVGDSLRDIQAANAANIKGVLVKTGKGAMELAQFADEFKACPVFDDLAAVVKDLLQPQKC